MPQIGNEAKLIQLLAKERANTYLARFGGLPLVEGHEPEQQTVDYLRWAGMHAYYGILEAIILELEKEG